MSVSDVDKATFSLLNSFCDFIIEGDLTMSASTICILVTIVLYLIMMVSIGAYFSRINKNTDDFYLGGRRLGPLVAAMSAEASDMSSWLLLGLPGLALATGLAEASWTAIGLAVGTYLNWLFVAKRLRVYTQKIDAVTIPDFFSKRFGDDKHILTMISALIIVIFFVPYTASGFAACGKLFSTMFGMDYVQTMLISAAVIVLYCTLGGFLAASTTDFIQSVIMTIALVVVLGFAEGVTNGFDNVFANVQSFDGYLDIFKGCNVETGAVGSYGALPIASTLAWGLGYFGMPHILLRFMAIDDKKKIKLSRRVASVWVVISMGVAILIGVAGYSLMKNGIVPHYADNSEAEAVVIDIAKVIASHGYIPCRSRRYHPRRHPCFHDVHIRLTAPCSSFCCFPEHPFRDIPHQDFRKGIHVGRKDLGYRYLRYRCSFRTRSFIFRIQDRLIRMGRLRCNIRSCCPSCTLLEKSKQVGHLLRYARRRCHDLHLEVHHPRTVRRHMAQYL